MMMKNIKQFKMPSVNNLTKAVKNDVQDTISDCQDVIHASQRLVANIKALQPASRQAVSWANAVQRDVQRRQSQAQPTIDKIKHQIEKLNQ